MTMSAPIANGVDRTLVALQLYSTDTYKRTTNSQQLNNGIRALYRLPGHTVSIKHSPNRG